MQCSLMSIFHNIYQGIADTCFIWCKEMKQVLKDEGVLIFFSLLSIRCCIHGFITTRLFTRFLYVWLTSRIPLCHVNSCVCVTLRLKFV